MGIPIFFYVKIAKKCEFPFFVLKMIEDFGNSHVFFTLATKKCLILGDFPMKIVIKFFGIPMSSLGGVHLISEMAQWCQTKEKNLRQIVFFFCFVLVFFANWFGKAINVKRVSKM